MSAFIFIAYFVLFSWLITKIKFFTASGLKNEYLIALFGLKIVAGLAYGWFYSQPQYYANSDTWNFYNLSLNETDWLLRDPAAFFKNIFQHGYEQTGGLFTGKDSYWNDLKTNVVIKLVAVVNVFTGKNYYANIIFFNFFFFFGTVAIYRLFMPAAKYKILLVAAIFCIPSFLFWYSGAHKDGLIFTVVALLMFYINKLFTYNKFKIEYLIKIIILLLLLFALRNYFIVLLLPAVIVWYLCHICPDKKAIVITAVYTFCVAIFFLAPYINSALDFPGYIVSKQLEFKQLGGNSQLQLPFLEPTFSSFIHYFPFAVDVAFLRPHLNEIENIAYIPAIGENILLGFVLAFLFYQHFSKKNKREIISNDVSNLFIFCFCFAVSVLILSGYTVTLTGAIVRYRAIALPLIFAPLVLNFKS